MKRMAKPSLRVIHSHGSADDLLFRGNAELAAGYPESALELYTKVLYELCPGHICAFLNRALAYIALGYPELAVMDAYRAGIICTETRHTPLLKQPDKVREMCQEVKRYIRAEKLHLRSGEPWTNAPECFVGSGWLRSDSASIVLTPIYEQVDVSRNRLWSEGNPSRVQENPPGVLANPSAEQEIPWNEFEIMATYRMCGALWYCGLGARSDALGFISDILKDGPYKVSEKQRIELLCLGDHIMCDLVKDLELNKSATKAMMNWKLTFVNRVIYPWNTYAPNMNLFNHLEELETFADASARVCTVRSVESRSAARVALRLAAANDIYPEDTVLSEQTILQVNTAGPTSSSGFFCDTCATYMITSDHPQPQTPLPKQLSWASSGASIGSTVSCTSSERSVDDSSMLKDAEAVRDDSHNFPQGKRASLSNMTRNSPPRTPPQAKLNITPDWDHCNLCMAAVFCCSDCFGIAGDFHLKLCNTEIEAEIRSAYHEKARKVAWEDLEAVGNKMTMHPKARCLYDLLFVRLYAMATDQKMNPLSLPEVRWLNGDLGEAASLQKVAEENRIAYSASTSTDNQTNRKTLPWTLMNNVLLPISYLRTMKIDPIINLDTTDGWIINTLYAKIMHSTRITHGVRYSKKYNEIGKLVSEAALAPETVKREVWVGTINPVFSMIGVADESIGEKPNVLVSEANMVKCFPVVHHEKHGGSDCKGVEVDISDDKNHDEEKKICIKAGEYILRSPNLGQGLVPAQMPGDALLAAWVEETREATQEVDDSENPGNERGWREHGS